MKSVLFGITIIGFLFSCGNNQEKLMDQNTQAQIDSSAIKISSDTTLVNIPNVYSEVDTNNYVKILKTGFYHEDEIWENVESGIWYEIFNDPIEDDREVTYFLGETEIIATRVYDPVVDEDESIQTGWEISREGMVENVLFIQGIKLDENKTLINVPIPNAELLPGDSLAFKYGDENYKLFATGTIIWDDHTSIYTVAEDYKLFFTTIKNGQRITELLVEHENFDDAMVSIIFIGDIDGDGFPDLILDTARHYNVDNPTLYLSGDADENQLLQVVGWHRSVGC